MHFLASAAAVAVLVAKVACVEPCAEIAQAAKKGDTKFNADIAIKCLRSVPVDTQGDLSQIEGFKTMVQFQSDLNYLKNPHPGFIYPGVDVLVTLDQIMSENKDGKYTNEYELQ